MSEEEISLKEFLSIKFENLGKDVSRLEGRYVEFERKNCEKHNAIFAKLNGMDALYNKRCEELEKVVDGDNVKSIIGLYDSAKNLGIKIIILLGIIGIIYVTYLIEIKKHI